MRACVAALCFMFTILPRARTWYRYYMCFSISIQGLSSAKEVATAFFEHGVHVDAATLHMAAYSSESQGVLGCFLDALGQTCRWTVWCVDCAPNVSFGCWP